MSPEEPVVVKVSASREKAGFFEQCREDALHDFETALGDGTTIFAYARLVVLDRKANQIIPTTNSSSTVAFGCGADHHIHVYVGIEDDVTHTSHLVHDISLANTHC